MKSLSAIKIPFNRPPYLGTELGHISIAIHSHKICGDGAFTKKCSDWLEDNTGCGKALLTTSGTSALEMAAILADIKEGDEVIMPSFTFVSTANAFVIRGSRIVFIDIRPDTMNIDERQIEAAITEHTKAIVPVHYAGVSCEMDTIMNLAETYRLQVIEDAAQAITSRYKGRPLGTLGNFGCLSFHETKMSPWEKEEPFFSGIVRTLSVQKSSVKKEQTGVNSFGAKLINTHGLISARPICQVN